MDATVIPHPTNSCLRQFIQDLTDHTIQVTSSNKQPLYEIHNTYTNYCLILLMHATGQRPVIDPVPHLHEIDLQSKLILINDKVSNENRDYRLVALPKIAREQIIHYLEYLSHLAFQLRKHNKNTERLIAAIHEILQNKQAQIPLFFYLDESLSISRSITPSLMQRFIEQHTWMPLHFGRHLIGTDLINQTNHADWAEIQLGHIESRDHPFGLISEISAIETLSLIGTAIQNALIGYGWQALSSPLPSSKLHEKTLTIISARHKDTRIHESELFGPARRLSIREEKRARHADLIRQVLTSFDEHKLDTLSNNEFEEIIDSIRIESERSGLSANHCLLLFYRWIMRLGKKQGRNPNIRRLLIIEGETSPFNTHTLANYQQARTARLRFIDHLTHASSKRESLTLEVRLAEITIAAALFSYITYRDRLNDIPAAVLSRAYLFKQIPFIDLICTANADQDKHNVFRWFPDNISLALISGLSCMSKTTYSKTKLYNSLNKLVKKISPEATKTHPLKIISQWSDSTLKIETPGYIRAAATGTVKSVSIPLQSFVRLVSGQKLNIDSKEASQDLLNPTLWSFSISGKESTDTKPRKKFFAELRALFRQAESIETDYKPYLSNKQKTALVKGIKKHINDGSDWNSTAKIIFAWAIHLCSKGSSHKANLKFSTIRKYVYLVSKAIMSLAYKDNILEYDQGMFEDLYCTAAQFTNRKDAAYDIGRLYDFHQFLTRYWAVDQPDWSSIYVSANCTGKIILADANILSEYEYLRAIQHIAHSESLNDRLKQQYILLLILGYRFNLRFGEAYRLQWRDVQIDIEYQELYVHVHSTHEGDVKSDAATRLVSSLHFERFSKYEIDAIQQLLNTVESSFQINKYVGLMCETDNHEKLIDRNITSTNINTLLRKITGDATIRFHHLRHSWANLSLINNNITDQLYKIDQFEQEQLGKSTFSHKKSSIRLKEASRLIGHATEETLLSNYLHMLDSVIYEYSQKITQALNSRSLAYCLGITDDTARKRLSSYKHYPDNYLRVCKPENFFKSPNISFSETNDTDHEFIFNLSNGAPSLLLINELLIALQQAFVDQENLAYRYSLSSHELAQFIQVVADCERVSGYGRFNIIKYSKQPLHNTSNTATVSDSINKSEESRTHKILYDLQQLINTLDPTQKRLLFQGIDIWGKQYDYVAKDVMVSTQTELDRYLDVFDILNLKDVPITIICPIEFKNQIKLNPASGHNLKITYSNMKLAKEKMVTWRQSRIIVRTDTPSSRFISRKTLTRVFFCLYIYSKLASDKYE